MSKSRFQALTPKQRGYLAQLAKQAHERLTASGAIDEPFETWRKREAMEASSGFTISEAPRHAFDDLETHFLSLTGQTKKAFDRATGPSNEERTIAHNIRVAAETCGVGEAYVAGICRKMFNRSTWEGAKQGQKVLIALSKAITRKNASNAA